MAENSKIEWTDATWNPLRARNLKTGKVGWHCEHATTGCEFCYAEGMNRRLGTGLPFKPGHRKNIEIFLDEDMLLAPLRWKRPRMIFVCSMTDAFAEFVKDEWLDKLFAAMKMCPQHTFQVLTKRPQRMRDYFAARTSGDPWAEAADHVAELAGIEDHPNVLEPRDLPLSNLWLGVSCEDQEQADARIPHLLQSPAAVRFVSGEPLLGMIRLDVDSGPHPSKLDWVIVGGESGPHARPMHPDWARSLRDQCAAAGVAYFHKQNGEWAKETPSAGGDLGGDMRAGRVCVVHRDQHSGEELLKQSFFRGDVYMRRIGKKSAGRLLDGKEHSEFPARHT
jgi:protein gp37